MGPLPSRFRRHLPLVSLITAVLVVLAGWSCSSRPPADGPAADADEPAWFEDVTERVGLNFVHDPGPVGTYFTPQSMGSGCAFFDCDGDGLVDIYLLHLGGPTGKKNQLFKQLPDHTFKDISAGSGLDIAGFSHGVAIGDVNNDGMPDVLVTQYGGIKLFLNRGGGKFEDVTEAAGLLNPLWAMSAAFVDYDRDGRLDLVVINYLDHDPSKKCYAPNKTREFCGPSHFQGVHSALFHNVTPSAEPGKAAPAVRFEDVSLASGIGKVKGPGLGVVCADFDGDGWPDIFVSNDGEPNRLWINQHDGTFKDEASRGVAYSGMGNAYAGMGIAVGDSAGSGMLDLFVTHLDTQTHTLWRQGPQRGQFTDVTAQSGFLGTATRYTGWGTVMADFNLDGALDLAIVNGRIYRGSAAKNTGLGYWEDYLEHNQLFANDGQGKFRDVSAGNPAFCGVWNVGRGLAVADYDNDGAPDLLVLSTGGPARLLRNIAPRRGHWLAVRPFDPRLQRDADGAEVRVRAGGKLWLRVAHPAQSYLSSCTPVALFGLGAAERVDAVEVIWPDGLREVFDGGAVDQPRTVRRGEGRAP
jgi:enediyne biosynthesis protein E4